GGGSGYGGIGYDGATATSAKPLTLSGVGIIGVNVGGSNLTMAGVIGQSFAGSTLTAYGPGTLTLTAANSYTAQTTVSNGGVLAIPTIANGGFNSPIGASSNAATNLVLGTASFGRGTLLLTGANSTYSTD